MTSCLWDVYGKQRYLVPRGGLQSKLGREQGAKNCSADGASLLAQHHEPGRTPERNKIRLPHRPASSWPQGKKPPTPALSKGERSPPMPAIHPRRSPKFRRRRSPKRLPRRGLNACPRHTLEECRGARVCSLAAAGNEKKAYASYVASPYQAYMGDATPVVGRWCWSRLFS